MTSIENINKIIKYLVVLSPWMHEQQAQFDSTFTVSQIETLFDKKTIVVRLLNKSHVVFVDVVFVVDVGGDGGGGGGYAI